jgi:hypothetical protein
MFKIVIYSYSKAKPQNKKPSCQLYVKRVIIAVREGFEPPQGI